MSKNQLLAHQADDSIQRMINSSRTNDAEVRYLSALKMMLDNSIKFKFCTDYFPSITNIEYIKLPYPVCYFEVEQKPLELKAVILNQHSESEIRGRVFDTVGGRLMPVYYGFRYKKNESGPGLSATVTIPKGLNFDAGDDAPIMEHNTLAIASSVAVALMLLNCENVKIKEHATPKMLNKKRKKKNKPPLSSYKTLVVYKPGDIGGEYQTIGETSSRRAHLRRGHIRRYKSGLQIFVNSCVVGDLGLGVVNKEYKIKSHKEVSS